MTFLVHDLTYDRTPDYKKELQSPHRLTKNEVVEHLQQYVANFNLNVILSATIRSTIYDSSEKKWTVKLQTANGGVQTIVSKHFVQATGLGNGKPYIPPMEDEALFKGLSIHSSKYRNTQALAEQGVKVCHGRFFSS